MIWQEKIFAPNFTSSPQGAKSAKNGHFHTFCPFWDCPRNCLFHQNMYITKTQDSSEKCFVPSSTSGPQGAKSAKNGHFPPVLPVFRLFAKLSSKHVYNQDTWLVRKKISYQVQKSGFVSACSFAIHEFWGSLKKIGRETKMFMHLQIWSSPLGVIIKWRYIHIWYTLASVRHTASFPIS